jgi:hypothetical protein
VHLERCLLAAKRSKELVTQKVSHQLMLRSGSGLYWEDFGNEDLAEIVRRPQA